MKEIRVHVKVPEPWNETRKKLNLTWRQVIAQGLKASVNGTELLKSLKTPAAIDPSVGKNLEAAVHAITNAWNTLNPST